MAGDEPDTSDIPEASEAWFERARLQFEPTHEMLVAGARSIGNTIRTDNHVARARACWAAMMAARDGTEEPIPLSRDRLARGDLGKPDAPENE